VSTASEIVTESAETNVALESSKKTEDVRVVYEEEEQTVTQSSDVVVTESGETVLVPTTTTTTRRIKYKEDSLMNASEDSKEASSANSSESSSGSTDFNHELDKQTEGMNPIEDIAESLFPTWGKIFATVIASLAGIGWQIYQKKKGSS
jgi:hypothetical protein